ncbi:SLAC1 anion channel family protein [Parvibaculaceae bacterium PLY_AMNH_Bact1]|nr:SLAC1 anion channel family protein [Parvibaculaceae bacterium PLY_AMNH_Bact1]
MIEKLKAISRTTSPAYFGVGMGLGGLASAWVQAASFLPAADGISHILFALTLSVSGLVSLLYTTKLVLHFRLVVEDFCDTNIANFFPGFTISLLLLASWLHGLGFAVSTPLWTFAAILHVVLAISVLRIWIVHNVEITIANPSMFVPIAGLFVVPATLPDDGSSTIAMFCFAVALLFWLALLPVVLNRILFHGQLPQQFLPTLFILIAPPALAATSTAVLSGAFTPLADGFLFAGLFVALLLASMARQFLSLTFQMSWWAFTFPSAALAGAALKRYTMLNEPDFGAGVLAVGLLLAATLIIGFVSWCTLRALISNSSNTDRDLTRS